MTQLVATAVIGLLGRERPTAMLLVPISLYQPSLYPTKTIIIHRWFLQLVGI
jgi:hypothetical protein